MYIYVNVFHSTSAVSYTHLHAQVKSTHVNCVEYSISVSYTHLVILFVIVVCSKWMGVRPVSYTHLDVYKRQVEDPKEPH